MRHCTQIWGEASLNYSVSLPTVVEDAIYFPFNDRVFINDDTQWGIYTSEGKLVFDGSYRRGGDLKLVGQSEAIDVNSIEIEDAPFDQMIYGGPIIPHFGHFVLTSLARLYAFDLKWLPILFHSSPPVLEHGLPFIKEFRAGIGLAESICMSSSKALRIRRLIVPPPSLTEQFAISPEYAASLSALGKKMSSSDFAAPAHVYLSKAKLSAGVSGFGGEDIIERAFSSAGFTIIYPENHTIAEQIRIFRSASVIAGTAGSAFHVMPFAAATPSTRILFSRNNYVNSNFMLLDHVCAGRSYYFSIEDYLAKEDRPGFDSYMAPVNPEVLAENMVGVTQAVANSQLWK